MVNSLGRGRDDVAAVAEDRRDVAQLEHLVEAMAHEQHRHAASAQAPHDREQPLDLVRGERRGRLVEDEHAGFDRQRLRDLDELLIGHRQATDRRTGVEMDVELLEQRVGSASRRAPVEDPEPSRRGVADEDVLGDGQVREESRLLVDDRDTERPGVGGPVDLRRLPVQKDRPAVGLVDAGQDLDQRALAGTVLADQGVDLAGQESERDVVEGLCRREALRDPAQLRARRDRHRLGRGRRLLDGQLAALVTSEPAPAPASETGSFDGPTMRTSTPRAVSACDHRGGSPPVGQDDIDLGGRAEGRERGALPLGAVDDRDDLARRGDHRALDLRLFVGGVGQARFEGEAGRAEERLLDVDPAEQAVPELADDREGLPAHATAEHQDHDARDARQAPTRCGGRW